MSPRAAWLTATDESPLAGLLLLPLLPVSWLYGLCAWLHRACYRFGLLRRSHLPERVVSVGSLVVGGAGKTPLAAWVARGLRQRGYKVALATRGYGGRLGDGVAIVSDGRRVRDRVEHVGDEALVLAARAPGVPVLAGRNRALVGWRALSAFGSEVLVLDDGFQHHALERDVDLVCFDGGLSLGNRRSLPRGPLREPIGALRDADAIAVVDGPLAPADGALLGRVAPGPRRIEAVRRPTQLRPLRGGEGVSPAELRGASVGLLAGLANPAEFRRTVESLGARVVAERLFPDHHRYRARDLRGLAAAAPLWVTTEKDAFKIVPPWVGRADVRVLAIDVDVVDGAAFLDWIETRLR